MILKRYESACMVTPRIFLAKRTIGYALQLTLFSQRIQMLRLTRSVSAGGLIPSDLAFLSDLPQIFAQPDQLTLLARPEPQGGETAFWIGAFDEDEHDEPFTYNEWWMALVLDSKFKGDRTKCRRAVQRKPDAAAKLALLDQLERRLAQDADYLGKLDYERPPGPEDYARAEHWFERESVNDTRAW